MVRVVERSDVQRCLDGYRATGETIGFVPTMGALHEGHLSLIKAAKSQTDRVAVSIFVNPLQFNNPADFDKYPVQLEQDAKLLQDAGCDLLFTPTVQVMYPNEVTKSYDFGMLENTMEGEFRPGHFNGVAVVVKAFFDIVKPDFAFFGEKDYQQLSIIRQLVRQENIPVEIVACPTIREENGLALSSRNLRLTNEQRKAAACIYDTFKYASDHIKSMPVEALTKQCIDMINKVPGFEVEYFVIADERSLQPLRKIETGARAFVAVYAGEVRLIDNMALNI